VTDAKKINHLFEGELIVISMGLDAFADTLRKEKVKVLQMNWKPPAGGDKRLLSLLERLEK
jgi:FdrA protein